MRSDEFGVPSVAFAQLLDGHALNDADDAAFRRIMSREGVDVAGLISGDNHVPLRWFREVFPNLDHVRGFRLGAQCAARAQLTSFGALSLPLVSAGSVAEVVELLAFLPLISDALGTRIHEGDDGLVVGLEGLTGDRGLDCLAVTYGGMAVLRLLDKLVGSEIGVALHLAFPAPADVDLSEPDVSRIEFGATSSQVFVPVRVAHEVCCFADPVSYRRGVEELEKAFAARSFDGWEHRVRKLVTTDPARADSRWVASEFAVSTSTLKRRLAAEGVTFRHVRQAALRERAVARLQDTSVTVSELAAELGFCDTASFSHAFTRWTGCSPRRYRNNVASTQRPAPEGTSVSQ